MKFVLGFRPYEPFQLDVLSWPVHALFASVQVPLLLYESYILDVDGRSQGLKNANVCIIEPQTGGVHDTTKSLPFKINFVNANPSSTIMFYPCS